MLITNPDPAKHLVEDYDFVLTSGQIIPVTVNRDAGDTIEFLSEPLAVRIHLVPKPSPINPQLTMPEEEYTLYQSHIMAVQKTKREVTDLTEAQKEQWSQAIKEFGGTSAIN